MVDYKQIYQNLQFFFLRVFNYLGIDFQFVRSSLIRNAIRELSRELCANDTCFSG